MFKRDIKTCNKCMENEADIDDFLTPVNFRGHFLFPKIPRVSKWVAHWQKRKLTFFIIYCLLIFFWFFGGGIVYLVIKHSGYVYNKVKSGDPGLDDKSVVDIVLFLENNTSVFVDCHTQSERPKVWLIPPKYKTECERLYAAKDSYLDVGSVVSFVDILRCFFISLIVLYQCSFRTKLQLYAVPDCLLTKMALRRFNISTLTCTAHFDRWAVMVDDFCAESKIQYKLIQHGSIKGIESKSNRHHRITNKLTEVDELIVYDGVEKELMFAYVIDSQHVPVNIIYAKPGFHVDGNMQGDILFVGHPLYESLHIAIYKSLTLDGYQVYYKGHPKARPSPLINHVGWSPIEESDSFPQVKLVISYHSTLALMYEDAGATVLIHENEEVNSSDYVSFINKIRKSLRHHDYH